MKHNITVLKVIFVICFTGCVAVDEKNQEIHKSVISNTEKQLRKPSTSKPASTNMKLQDYAIYRNGENAQRENREVLVDNFIRGLTIDGF
tara:strand:+ start:253 stop:522 length:270 start_codon:yes stop_codon:yes gene_type:complete